MPAVTTPGRHQRWTDANPRLLEDARKLVAKAEATLASNPPVGDRSSGLRWIADALGWSKVLAGYDRGQKIDQAQADVRLKREMAAERVRALEADLAQMGVNATFDGKVPNITKTAKELADARDEAKAWAATAANLGLFDHDESFARDALTELPFEAALDAWAIGKVMITRGLAMKSMQGRRMTARGEQITNFTFATRPPGGSWLQGNIDTMDPDQRRYASALMNIIDEMNLPQKYAAQMETVFA